MPSLRSRFARFLLHALTGCSLVLVSAGQTATSAFDQTHAAWTAVLKACVRDGGFDYAKLKQDRAGFDGYLSSLRAVAPAELAGWSEEQRFAFWINAYNAHCIEKVVDHYPLKSIRKLGGLLSSVFDDACIPMPAHHPEGKGKKLSLNDIEHGILRKQFKDARLHAAVNCASASCPPLRGEAFVAERLDAQLEEQMRLFVADGTRNKIDPGKSQIEVSEIFKWFAEDFEREAKTVQEYIARFAPPAQATFIRSGKLRYLDYDWDLNDVPE